MNTIRYIKIVFALLILLTYGAEQTWADKTIAVSAINITIKNGGSSTIEPSVSTLQTDASGNYFIVTLTVHPATGYELTLGNITVQPLADPAGSRSITPGIAETLTVTGSGNSYSFNLPERYDGALVTATFTLVHLDDIESLNEISSETGHYKVKDGITTLTGTPQVTTFKGVLDGNFAQISLNSPLFTTIEDAVIRNVIISSVSISQDGSVGAIAGTAKGASRIYNCGILSGSVKSTGTSSTNNSADCCGGIVGCLDGSSRVINCYSYADITGGNHVGGIVGYNNVATSADPSKPATYLKTMVMNCMFYGDITGGNKAYPVYGGKKIVNKTGEYGLNNFNYYAYDKAVTFNDYPTTKKSYNCALAAEGKYLERIEFFRLLLNSNRKLAAYYATGSADNAGQMAKWVLETADRRNSNPKPYPVLKAQGKYPSIINIDAEHAGQLSLTNGKPSEEDRNKGGKLGTLTVNINSVGSNAPSGASITTTSPLILNRTDKDEDRYNFNYDKVQLPYYNDVGTGNYTGNKVVTGWKITAIDAITGDPYTSSHYPTSGVTDYPYHNYADRKSSNKDKFGVSGRVFSQGAYFDVPYGVSSITIEPYWGNAAYVADEYLDVVCKLNTSGRNHYDPESVTQLGKQFPDGTITINGSKQTVYTSISAALGDSHLNTGDKVYDNAVVLVGNLHQIGVPSAGDKAFTMMSVDLDEDNEPDYSLIYCDNDRNAVSPIRFDFLNIPGMSQAQKPYDNDKALLNAAIFKTKGWFEVTNTALIFFTQYEYENLKSTTKSDSPLIFLGGYIDQFVSTQSDNVTGKTIYIHVGSNVLINSFGLGTHSDGDKATPHVPVSVTGGDFKEFYLTGTYNQNAAISDDNAECYISGGRFGELAGAAQEQIGSNNSANNGNVRWQIYDADITEFYGGGVNDAKPVQGNITTDIFNSHVGTFCGGPKFGNMSSGKTVITTAEGCNFNKFFGAGFGGNSYSRKKYFDSSSGISWGTTLQGYYTTDRGHYFDGSTTNSRSGGTGDAQYGKKGPGVATDFDYEYFVWTSGAVGGRFFVKFASFSLAQCNNVTSTLTDCTIDENFYGGGSRGKVKGTVTSVLDGCKVKGNVFGAGYSGTPDPVPVRSAGFTDVPTFDGGSGMFKPGVLSTIDYYDWMQKSSYPDNGDVGFLNDSGSYELTGDNVVTKVDITSANLGSVEGSVNLTIKGDSKIGTDGDSTKGNVYGGGDASYVRGSGNKVTVNLQGETKVLGSVFGGGNEGKVEGSTEVKIE